MFSQFSRETAAQSTIPFFEGFLSPIQVARITFVGVLGQSLFYETIGLKNIQWHGSISVSLL
jgi:hypothetical protein